MSQTMFEWKLNPDAMVDEKKDPDVLDCCSRCGGLLVGDRCYDLSSSGIFKIAIKRCVQCGDVIDPMILKHRSQSTL